MLNKVNVAALQWTNIFIMIHTCNIGRYTSKSHIIRPIKTRIIAYDLSRWIIEMLRRSPTL